MAHDAPSGWTYSYQCCSGIDCAPYHTHIRETPRGYFIPLTSETIAYDSHRIKPSGDDEFHLCLYPPTAALDVRGKIRCLYVPGRSF
jgi:hypothetical protein